jgi:hypothetical protein
MLTAAAILMSLGTNAVSGHPVASGSPGSESALFAESFLEGAVLAGAVQPQSLRKTLLPATGSKENAAGTKIDVAVDEAAAEKPVLGLSLPSGATKVEVAGAKTPSQPQAAKTAVTLMPGKVVPSAQIPTSQTKTAADALPSVQEEDASAKQPAPADAKSVAQEPPDAMDVADTTSPETDPTATPAPAVLDANVKEAVAEMKDDAAPPASTRDRTSTSAESKDHDAAAKPIKAAKPKDQQAKDAVAAVSVGTAQVTNTVAVPLAPPAVNVQQGGAAVVKNDTSTPIPSAVTKRSGGAAASINRKGKEAVIAEKPAASVASPSVPDDGTSSHKAGLEAKKVTASVTSQDSPKVQDAGTAAPAAAHPAHAETGATAASVATVNAIPIHGSGPRVQAADAGGHGGAAPQSELHAVDAARPSEAAPQMLQATPNSIEVGVASGTHGWLKIRAEMSGGGVVNASLSTASTSGQEMLHRELPSLTAYLQSERVAVHSVVVQPVAASAAMPREFGGRMNGQGGGQSPQNGAQGGDGRQERASSTSNRMSANVEYRSVTEASEEYVSPTIYMAGRSWLSVRA